MRIFTLSALVLGLILSLPADLASAGGKGKGKGKKGGDDYRGAPSPVVGVGLPFLLVAGGAYWAARRYRSKLQQDI